MLEIYEDQQLSLSLDIDTASSVSEFTFSRICQKSQKIDYLLAPSCLFGLHPDEQLFFGQNVNFNS